MCGFDKLYGVRHRVDDVLILWPVGLYMWKLSTVTKLGTTDDVFDKIVSARFNGSWRYVFGF